MPYIIRGVIRLGQTSILNFIHLFHSNHRKRNSKIYGKSIMFIVNFGFWSIFGHSHFIWFKLRYLSSRLTHTSVYKTNTQSRTTKFTIDWLSHGSLKSRADVYEWWELLLNSFRWFRRKSGTFTVEQRAMMMMMMTITRNNIVRVWRVLNSKSVNNLFRCVNGTYAFRMFHKYFPILQLIFSKLLLSRRWKCFAIVLLHVFNSKV